MKFDREKQLKKGKRKGKGKKKNSQKKKKKREKKEKHFFSRRTVENCKHSRYFHKEVRKIRKMLEIPRIDAKVHSFSSFIQLYP